MPIGRVRPYNPVVRGIIGYAIYKTGFGDSWIAAI